jgi:GT2 family glycosyltransferase
MEESDVSLQLFARGWRVETAKSLRVFHDTELKHHDAPEITIYSIMNIALRVYLNYPIVGWGFGLLQIANKIVDCVKRRRLSGIAFAILHIPSYCFHYRRLREPIEWRVIKRYAELSRNGGVLE